MAASPPSALTVLQPPQPRRANGRGTADTLGNVPKQPPSVVGAAPARHPMRPPGDFRRRRLTERQQGTAGSTLHSAVIERRAGGPRRQIRIALPFHERVVV